MLLEPFKRDPHFIENVGQIVMMGGSFNGIGNITQTAEFNIHCDPKAPASVSCPGQKNTHPSRYHLSGSVFAEFNGITTSESNVIGRFLHQVVPYLFPILSSAIRIRDHSDS